ncbi:MAG: TIGR03960 family B12-binding radical SAM protein [Anaerolineales bacterium]|nr:TIGR03960 family B12-binding radical SAM protein [Anaerolineales bacterium]
MLTPEQIETRLERILLKVQKPGRYVGGEMNSLTKDWDSAQTRVALVFPEIYDIGVSNVGMKILYDQVNQREDALAERAYAPWVDMEKIMRENHIPLYTLESRRPLSSFDIVGFSIPYETLYTNTLNILDLAGIPILAAERGDDEPIVIAGGHSTMNPEPMHAFMDAFVIGEGEEVIHDIITSLQENKPGRASRGERLKALAGIPGVYVPSLYEVDTFEDGTIRRIRPLVPEAPETVTKRIVAKLPPPPTDFIVPNISIVHDRATVEIMRGCTRGCRFCQAGMITRPVRERSVEEVVRAAEKAVAATGIDELSFLSLSSSDYTHILELVETISDRFKGRQISIALPSMRIESVSIDLMETLRERRGTGFTLAPEAATERMRRIINKYIPDSQILETAREIYRRNWTTIKLYFMIGHPSETLEDVKAIASLCKQVLAEGRKVIGMKARVHAGISTFVPKPHTPFQWVSCDTVEQIMDKQALLRQELRDRNIKLSWTETRDTLLEAWLTRGDRRISRVIQAAWEKGAKFDAWGEHMRNEAWMEAFEENGLAPSFYTHRPRPADEIFPWEHISTAVRKDYLYQDYRQSLDGQVRSDCREQCFACGILPVFSDLRRETPGESWKCPEVRSPRQP